MGILDNAKELAELIKKYNDLDLYEKILDLRDEIFALREENQSLKEKIKNYNYSDSVRGRMIRDGNVYYLDNEDGTKSGPYCLTCWDDEKKLINVITERIAGRSTFRCGRCQKK